MLRQVTIRGWVMVLLAWVAFWASACAAEGQMPGAMAPLSPQVDTAGMKAAAAPAARELAQDSPAMPSEAAMAAAPSPARPAAAGKAASAAVPPQQAKSGDGKDGATTPVEPSARPMLIYEAQVGVLVDEGKLAETIEKIIDAAESKGGYLVSRGDQTVAVRVPSQQLRAALADIEPLGQVMRRSVTAQDVSDQFHDLEVRLKSLEAVRDRLQQFLSRATNMSEAMTIAAQLDQVAQQIDQVKGQMQLLRTRAAYSLIQVTLQPRPRTVVAEPREPIKPPEARPARLPVDWLNRVGLDSLTRLEGAD